MELVTTPWPCNQVLNSYPLVLMNVMYKLISTWKPEIQVSSNIFSLTTGLFFISETHETTVKPAYNGHLLDLQIVVVVDRWSLFRVHLCNNSSEWDLKIVVVIDRWSLSEMDVSSGFTVVISQETIFQNSWNCFQLFMRAGMDLCQNFNKIWLTNVTFIHISNWGPVLEKWKFSYCLFDFKQNEWTKRKNKIAFVNHQYNIRT